MGSTRSQPSQETLKMQWYPIKNWAVKKPAMLVTCKRCFDFSAETMRSFYDYSYLNSVLAIVCSVLSWNICSRTIGSSKNFVCLIYSSHTRLTVTCWPFEEPVVELFFVVFAELYSSVSSSIAADAAENSRLFSTCFRIVAIVDECKLLNPAALHFENS